MKTRREMLRELTTEWLRLDDALAAWYVEQGLDDGAEDDTPFDEEQWAVEKRLLYGQLAHEAEGFWDAGILTIGAALDDMESEIPANERLKSHRPLVIVVSKDDYKRAANAFKEAAFAAFKVADLFEEFS